jgi:hypothetical protein
LVAEKFGGNLAARAALANYHEKREKTRAGLVVANFFGLSRISWLFRHNRLPKHKSGINPSFVSGWLLTSGAPTDADQSLT